jgi:hypothetical protein
VSVDPVETSAAFLAAVRRNEDPQPHVDALAALDPDDLAAALDTDPARIAFWLNVYNAAAQHALAVDPDRYEPRRKFFGADLVTVAGRSLSLDAIEHRILRRGYPKWTLGYLRWPFVGDYARQLAPSERDPRIHFALNCGAASCPAILAYTREDLEEQLDDATRSHLEATVEYAPDAGRVRVPRVFLWFRGDFGGKSGILAFLRRYDQLPAGVSPRLTHRDWDWSLEPGDFAEE